MIKDLRSRLLQGELVFGSWLNLGSSLTTELMCRAGFDWLCIDMEHGTGDFQELVGHFQAMGAYPTAPIVRVTAAEPWMMKRALDLGASGLVIPLIESAEHARAVIGGMLYPPHGIRGVAASTRAAWFGSDYAEYFAQANQTVLKIIQIERCPALDDIDNIAAIPELDVLFVGPVDLTVALGVPNQLDSPVAQAALARIEQAAHRNGKALGILLPKPELVGPYLGRGYRFVGVGSDGVLLNNAARALGSALHALVPAAA